MADKNSTLELLQYVRRARDDRDQVAMEMVRFKTDQFLRSVIRKKGVRSGDLDAILDDVYDRAWTSLPSFDESKQGSFMAWIAGIARRAIPSYFRTHPRTVSIQSSHDFPDTVSSPTEIHRKERIREVVGEALRKMRNPRRRQVVCLFYFNDMSYKDIVEAMNLPSVESARQLMYYACLDLRKTLTDMGYGGGAASIS